MAERPRFRIMDLVVLVAACAMAAAAWVALDHMNEADQGKLAFWLVFAGVVLVGYLAVRFAPTREARLIVLGLAVAFAGAADAMFLDAYMDAPTRAVVACVGLSLASLVLLVAGAVHGLRNGGVGPPMAPADPTEATPSPHPLDLETSS